MKLFVNLSAVMCAALVFSTAHADTVIMKTGTLLEAEEVTRDDSTVEFKVEFGTVRVAIDNILRIEKDTPEQIALKEKKAADAKELAEQMKEEGKVQYKGKWVTEKEKADEEKKVAEAKKKKQKEREESAKKAEAEAKKKKDAEQKRLADAQKANSNNNGGFDDVRADRFAARHGGSSNHNGRNGSSYNRYNDNNNGYNGYGNNSYGNNYGSYVNTGAIDQLLGGYRRGR